MNKIAGIVKPFVFLLLLIGTSVLVACSTGTGPQGITSTPAPAPIDRNTNTPVVLVHGFNGARTGSGQGFSCHGSNGFGPLITYLQGTHKVLGKLVQWKGKIDTVKYYKQDVECDTDLHSSTIESHCTDVHAAPSNDMTNNEDLRHLACLLGWHVYESYTAQGQSVDLVAHSMGGVIVRYALYAVQHNVQGFPSQLFVNDIVTLESPLGGISDIKKFVENAASRLDIGGCTNCTQLNDLDSDGPLFKEVKNSLDWKQPQPSVDWTTIGSDGDPIVSSSSATDIVSAHRTIYTDPAYDHGGVLNDPKDAEDATIRYYDHKGNKWAVASNIPHSLHYVLYALARGDW